MHSGWDTSRVAKLGGLVLLAALFLAPAAARSDDYHGLDFGGGESSPSVTSPRSSDEDPFQSPYVGQPRRRSGGSATTSAPDAAASAGSGAPATASAASSDTPIAVPPLFARASSVFRDRVPVPPGRTYAQAAAQQALSSNGPSASLSAPGPSTSAPQPGGMPGSPVAGAGNEGQPPPEGPEGPQGQVPGMRPEAPGAPRLASVMADLEQSTLTVEAAQRARAKEKEEQQAARRGPNRLPARLLDKVHRER